jgi:hypothetical protein
MGCRYLKKVVAAYMILHLKSNTARYRRYICGSESTVRQQLAARSVQYTVHGAGNKLGSSANNKSSPSRAWPIPADNRHRADRAMAFGGGIWRSPLTGACVASKPLTQPLVEQRVHVAAVGNEQTRPLET